jgi:hypothetical protein
LLGLQLDVFQFEHPLQIAGLCEKEMGRQNILHDGADLGERQRGASSRAAFALEEAVGQRDQDDVALPAGQRAPSK